MSRSYLLLHTQQDTYDVITTDNMSCSYLLFHTQDTDWVYIKTYTEPTDCALLVLTYVDTPHNRITSGQSNFILLSKVKKIWTRNDVEVNDVEVNYVKQLSFILSIQNSYTVATRLCKFCKQVFLSDRFS